MMHFVLEAQFEDGMWTAGCSVEVPAGAIITEGATKEELEANVKDAIETFLSYPPTKDEIEFTFEIVYA